MASDSGWASRPKDPKTAGNGWGLGPNSSEPKGIVARATEFLVQHNLPRGIQTELFLNPTAAARRFMEPLSRADRLKLKEFAEKQS